MSDPNVLAFGSAEKIFCLSSGARQTKGLGGGKTGAGKSRCGSSIIDPRELRCIHRDEIYLKVKRCRCVRGED